MHDFRRWLVEQRYAPTTIKNYVNYVKRAHLALGTLRGQDAETLAHWTATLSNGSAAGAKKALVKWFDYKRATHNPALRMPKVTTTAGHPRPLTAEQRSRFLTAADQLGGIHRALGYLFEFTGARISSVRFAHWRAFVLTSEDPTWTWVGKGANRSGPRSHTIPLHPALVDVMRVWRLTSRGPQVFPGRSAGGVLSDSALRDLHTTICDHAGLEGVTPHRHRHDVGSLIYEATGDIMAVKEVLGHDSLNTARIYTKPSTSRIRAALETLPAF